MGNAESCNPQKCCAGDFSVCQPRNPESGPALIAPKDISNIGAPMQSPSFYEHSSPCGVGTGKWRPRTSYMPTTTPTPTASPKAILKASPKANSRTVSSDASIGLHLGARHQDGTASGGPSSGRAASGGPSSGRAASGGLQSGRAASGRAASGGPSSGRAASGGPSSGRAASGDLQSGTQRKPSQDEGESRLKEIKRRAALTDAAAGSQKKTQTTAGKSEKKWAENVVVKEEEEEEDYERLQEALDKKEAEAAHVTISRCASSIQRVCESFSKANHSLSRNRVILCPVCRPPTSNPECICKLLEQDSEVQVAQEKDLRQRSLKKKGLSYVTKLEKSRTIPLEEFRRPPKRPVQVVSEDGEIIGEWSFEKPVRKEYKQDTDYFEEVNRCEYLTFDRIHEQSKVTAKVPNPTKRPSLHETPITHSANFGKYFRMYQEAEKLGLDTFK